MKRMANSKIVWISIFSARKHSRQGRAPAATVLHSAARKSLQRQGSILRNSAHCWLKIVYSSTILWPVKGNVLWSFSHTWLWLFRQTFQQRQNELCAAFAAPTVFNFNTPYIGLYTPRTHAYNGCIYTRVQTQSFLLLDGFSNSAKKQFYRKLVTRTSLTQFFLQYYISSLPISAKFI